MFPQDSSDDEDTRFWEEDERTGPAVFMYVDDTMLVDIVPTEDASLHLTTGMARAHFCSLKLEGDFGELNRRAEKIKMKVNAKKTQLLVVSPPPGITRWRQYTRKGR